MSTNPQALFTRMSRAALVKRVKRSLPTILLSLILVVAFLMKLRVMTQYSLITGDGSNYLVTMHRVFGYDVTGMGPLRPPLIAIPLKIACLIWGPMGAIRVVGLVIAASIGIPFYLLATRVSSPVIALLTTVLFLFTPKYSVMLGWGYITLFGLFFSLFTFYFLLKAIEKPSYGNILLAGLMASLIAGFHQVSLVIFLAIMAAFSILLVLSDFKNIRRTFPPLIASGVIAAILAIPYVPAYLNQFHQVPPTSGAATFFPTGLVSVATLAARMKYFYEPAHLWLLALPGVVMGLIAMRQQDRRPYLLLVSALLVTFSLGFSDAQPLANRAIYFSFFPLWLLFAGGVSWGVAEALKGG